MKRLLAACLSLAIAGVAKADEQSTSPYATAADFAKYAMKLREQALLKVEPQVFVPTSSHPAIQRFPWKTSIVTTVFWLENKPEVIILCPISGVPGTRIGQLVTAASIIQIHRPGGIISRWHLSRTKTPSTVLYRTMMSRTVSSNRKRRS